MTHLSSISGTASDAHSSSDSEPLLAAFARSLALPREFGKCNVELKIWVPDSMKADMKMLSGSVSMGVSDWSRLQLIAAMYGPDVARRVHTERVDKALGLRAETGPLSGVFR